MEAGDAGDGRDHHAGEQLHGGDVFFVEGAGRCREHFEDAESAAIVTQRADQDGADAEASATGEIDAGVAFGVVAEHDFAGADGFGGDAGFGLQANTEVGSGASGAGAADDFIAGAQSDGGAGGAGKMLGALGDGADGGLEIQLASVNVDFFSGADSPESGDGVSAVGNAKLAAQRG